MDESSLKILLSRLGIQGLVRRNNNLMGCCPNHNERRPSWGMQIAEPHAHGCFACGFNGTLRSLLLRKFEWSKTDVDNLLGVPGELRTVRDESFSLRDADAPIPPKVPEYNLYPFKKDGMLSYLRQRRINRITSDFAGLLFHHVDNRLIFPWYYDPDYLIGATGRTLDPDPDVPKIVAYFGLRKGEYFYVPSKKLRADQPLILVEGEIDALRVMQSGYPNVAALSFGRFSKKQYEYIQKLSPVSVITFFDDDKVGHALTTEVVRVLRPIVPIQSVAYSLLKGSGDKRDPGDLSDLQVSFLIRRTLRNFTGRYSVDWSSFNLGIT